MSKEQSARVDLIADNLVRRFKAPGSRPFFCKVAWKLSENEIELIFEKAHSGKIRSPIKYFVAACKNKIG